MEPLLVRAQSAYKDIRTHSFRHTDTHRHTHPDRHTDTDTHTHTHTHTHTPVSYTHLRAPETSCQRV